MKVLRKNFKREWEFILISLKREYGGVAQLGEHLLCKQGVIGSIPFISTKDRIGFKATKVSEKQMKSKGLKKETDPDRKSIWAYSSAG